jgi:hypothetical protein
MASFVAAGLVSPLSVGGAMAGCSSAQATTNANVYYCTDFSTNGETVTENARDMEVYIGWDGGNSGFNDFEIADGTHIIQNRSGASVSVGIFGGNIDQDVPNIFENPDLDGTLFDIPANSTIPVTFSNDGNLDSPDNEGSAFHALEIDANNGAVNLVAIGDITFETTGTGQDGINIATKGGPAFVFTTADFDVLQDGMDILTRGGDAFVGYVGEMAAGEDGIEINTAVNNNNPDGGDIFVYVGEASDSEFGDDVVEIDAVGNGLNLRAGNNTGTVGAWIAGDIDAGLSAVRAVGGDVFLGVGQDSTVTGLGSNTTTPVIYLNGRDSNVLFNLGEIASNGTDVPADQARRMAVEVGRGAASIYNFGTLTGRIDASNSNDEVVNGGLWQFAGETRFGADVDDADEFPGEDEDGDVLRNIFYSDEEEEEVGYGVIVNAFDGELSETAQYTGLEKFYNGGVISLQDQEFGEDFNRDRAYTDGDFIGEEGLLAIDANLSDSGSGPDADRFIIGGNVSGTTYVDIDIVGFGQAMYNGMGIPVIEVAGDVDAGTTFELNDGPIDAGLFTYDLYYVDEIDEDYYYQDDNYLDGLSLATADLATVPTIDSMWVLASTLDAEAYQLPVLMYGAQNLWHASAGVWGDRTTDLRAAFGTGFGGGGADMAVVDAAPSTAAIGPGFWGRAFGGTLERDFDNSSDLPGGGTVGFEDSFRQNYYGFVGGLDAVHDVTANSAVLWGLLGGLTGSDLDFDLSDGQADYQQVSIGAYATYLNGGFFADVLAKADFGNMDYSADGDSGDSSYTSVGVSADMGYRFGFATGWFIEPKATLAYVNTSFDDVDILGAGVSFEDGDSLRGRLGGRLGTTIDNGTRLITPYIEASVWNEFDGDYGASFYDIGGTPSVGYDAGGTYGEVVAGADIVNVGAGWSAFGKGAVQFGDDEMLGFSGNLGLRKSW